MPQRCGSGLLRPFRCTGPSCSRSYGFASRKRRAQRPRLPRKVVKGVEGVSKKQMRDARCSRTMYATRAEHELIRRSKIFDV